MKNKGRALIIIAFIILGILVSSILNCKDWLSFKIFNDVGLLGTFLTFVGLLISGIAILNKEK